VPAHELPPIDLTVSTVQAGEHAYVVSVQGELDLYTTPQLTAELEAIVDGLEVVLDLSGVTFLDSTALGAILLAARRLREEDGGLALVTAEASTKKLLEVVGVDRVVPVFDTSERALEHLVGSLVLRRLEQTPEG
jgi:anti-sigma B factor antagonist